MQRFKLYNNDIPTEIANSIREKRVIAIDIETTGLDWHSDKIGLIQLYDGSEVYIIKISSHKPQNLIGIINDRQIRKIFHFAVFDLRFIWNNWEVSPENIFCTKIASKILRKNTKNHSLESLLFEYLNINIDKNYDIRTSDWTAENLTEEHFKYASNDVLYLIDLMFLFENEFKKNGIVDFTSAAFNFIPFKIQLDINGMSELYEY